jgi:two-component system chemotaxis response regulator CheY
VDRGHVDDRREAKEHVKKVLVVDDSQSLRQQVAEALEQAGFTVLEAQDGVQGLARLAEHEDVSLILLDVNMPAMGGMEMLDRLAQPSGRAQIPVLMLTTEAERSLIARAKAAGAKGWLIKPIKSELLVSAVSKVCR